VHAHLGCCIENTDYYECSLGTLPNERSPRPMWNWGLRNAPLVEDGHVTPPDGPGWGAVWDEEQFQSLVVETY
jgi:L-alanine-DL-glutamate epimerase-like enolase superfamily enzyme